jgi:hypothetical protein
VIIQVIVDCCAAFCILVTRDLIKQDAGHTQIAAGSRTVLAIGPGELRITPVVMTNSHLSHRAAPASAVDEITGGLGLL